MDRGSGGGGAAAATPLHPSSSSSSTHYTYYRPEALFSMRADVVRGYHILLSKTDLDLNVSYGAILDGKILHECLGVTPSDPSLPPSFNQALARTRGYLARFREDERKKREIIYAYTTLYRTLDEYHCELQEGMCGGCCWGGREGGRVGGLCAWCWAPCRFVWRKVCCGEEKMRKEVLRVLEEVFGAMVKELEAK